MSTLQEDAQRFLPFVRAMAEGKTVEMREEDMEEWIVKTSFSGWDTSGHLEYRIKPESKYRPFTLEEMQKAIGRVIRRKSNECLHQIHTVDSCGDVLMGSATWNFQNLLSDWEFYDPATGATSPFGALETE